MQQDMKTDFPTFPALLMILAGVLIGGTLLGWERIPEKLQSYGLDVNIGGREQSDAGFWGGSLKVSVNGRRSRDTRRSLWACSGCTLRLRYRADVEQGRLYLGVTQIGIRYGRSGTRASKAQENGVRRCR
jgi:hypothetical protein